MCLAVFIHFEINAKYMYLFCTSHNCELQGKEYAGVPMPHGLAPLIGERKRIICKRECNESVHLSDLYVPVWDKVSLAIQFMDCLDFLHPKVFIRRKIIIYPNIIEKENPIDTKNHGIGTERINCISIFWQAWTITQNDGSI